MENTFKNNLYKLLKKDARLWNEETKELNETLLKDLIDKLDEKLIELLLNNKETKEKFFIKVKDVFVLKQNDLKFFIDENKLDNSYTQYQNKIGLRVGNKLLSERNEVVLDWPFKDCVLEGGMTKEDQKRNEIFFNEVLAKDEIDRLEDPKALVNWKRYTAKGEEKVKELKRDKDGTIRENLIIKGNNLLALHSLKEQFAGKVKLIFIDPPYNIGGNDFPYNDNFNESAWLTFIKNRISVAYELLSQDGAIYVSIDHHENHALKMILKEIFKNNFIQEITIKTADPAGFKIVNPGPVEVTENIYVFAKNKDKYLKTEKKLFVADSGVIYPSIILNINDNYKKWKVESTKKVALKKLGFQSEKELKNKFGARVAQSLLLSELESVCIENANAVFTTYKPDNPSPKMAEVAEKSKLESTMFKEYEKADGGKYYLLNGRVVAFYSSKLKNIDGELVPTRHLTNLWTDISWSSVDKERGIKLPRGKKPEKLLKRIIDLCTEKNDLVLDFFMGSGTTCGVSHKMGRQYIGIEQLDYVENDAVYGLANVIKGDQTGVSKAANWKGGGDFIYVELARWNEEAKEKILKAKSLNELEKLFDELYERYFLNYNLETKKFKEKVIKEEGFKKLSLNEQKKFFVEMLDMNQMYVNFSERADKKYSLSKEDIALSEKFYNAKK